MLELRLGYEVHEMKQMANYNNNNINVRNIYVTIAIRYNNKIY